MDEVEVAKVTEYAAEDADAAWRLEAILAPKLREEGLWDLYTDLERPLIGVLANMEAVGVKVDVARLRALSDEFARADEGDRDRDLLARRPRVQHRLGPQLRQILFDELKLPVVSKTPGGEPSTAVEVLEELASQHPLPRLLDPASPTLEAQEHVSRRPARRWSCRRTAGSTPRSTRSSRRRAGSAQATRTCRTSPSAPRTAGRSARRSSPGFPGWSLLTADYSQIELRILAHYSKDPTLVDAFAERPRHPLRRRLADLQRARERRSTPDQRRMAKTVNFGVIYGLSAVRPGDPAGDHADGGRRIHRRLLPASMPGSTHSSAGRSNRPRRPGKVETILGRRRADQRDQEHRPDEPTRPSGSPSTR